MNTAYASENHESIFLRKWALANLFGSLLGWLYFFASVLFIFDLPLFGDDISFITIGAIIGLPFGAILGLFQWFVLRTLRIQPAMWIVATSLGCGITFSTMAFFWDEPSLSPLWAVATLLVDGTIIGGLQFVAMSKILSNPKSWLVANALGQLAVGVLTFSVYSLAFVFKSIFLKFFYSHQLYGLAGARHFLLFALLIIVVPVLSASSMAIPTGKALWKHIPSTAIPKVF
jgi:hypothetical protein